MQKTLIYKASRLVAILGLAIPASWAQITGPGFTANFSQCTEFAGVGPVNFAKASALVPAVFTTLPEGSTGAIVVRGTGCGGVQVNGGPSIPTNISQIGVEIVSPDGTGTINNYTLIYVSNNPELVWALNLTGVPALFDPTLTYQFTYNSATAGELYVEVEGLGLPAYFMAGTETDPTAPGSDFKANWWYLAGDNIVKQASDFPDIAFGTSSVTLYTDKTSFLGQLIGGNFDSNFSFLPVRGVYATAHMVVTVTPK